MIKSYSILLIVLLVIGGCQNRIATPCEVGLNQFPENFKLGIAIHSEPMNYNDEYAEIVISNFNLFSLQDELQFAASHTALHTYHFEAADAVLSVAQSLAIPVHGQPLITSNNLPKWLINYAGNKHYVFENHLTTTIQHFGSTIQSWDVVSEALSENGELSPNFWYNAIGVDYVAQAFQFAGQTGTQALLFYNDFNLESNEVKLNAAISMCEEMRKRGIRIDGIGMQMHIDLDFPEIATIEKAANKIANAGFKVHFSQVDVSLNPFHQQKTFSKHDFELQAKRYAELVRVYQRLPADAQFAFTIWGLTDHQSWLLKKYDAPDAPLLFDAYLEPKLAYCSFINSLE